MRHGRHGKKIKIKMSLAALVQILQNGFHIRFWFWTAFGSRCFCAHNSQSPAEPFLYFITMVTSPRLTLPSNDVRNLFLNNPPEESDEMDPFVERRLTIPVATLADTISPNNVFGELLDQASLVQTDGSCYILNLDDCGDFYWMIHNEIHYWVEVTLGCNDYSLSVYPWRNLGQTPTANQIEPTMQALGQVLARADTLKEFQIEGCDRSRSPLPLPTDTLGALFTSSSTSGKRTIIFEKLSFTSDQIRACVSAMTENTMLVIDRCNLEDDGLSIVEALEGNRPGLAHLFFKNEGFPVTTHGMRERFCVALGRNTNLKSLHVENGALMDMLNDPCLWSSFVAAIGNNRGLRHFSVEGNSIDNEQCSGLLNALLMDGIIEVLNLNNISDDLPPTERERRGQALQDFYKSRAILTASAPGTANPHEEVPHIVEPDPPHQEPEIALAAMRLAVSAESDHVPEDNVPMKTEQVGPAFRTRSKRTLEEVEAAPRRSKRRRLA